VTDPDEQAGVAEGLGQILPPWERRPRRDWTSQTVVGPKPVAPGAALPLGRRLPGGAFASLRNSPRAIQRGQGPPRGIQTFGKGRFQLPGSARITRAAVREALDRAKLRKLAPLVPVKAPEALAPVPPEPPAQPQPRDEAPTAPQGGPGAHAGPRVHVRGGGRHQAPRGGKTKGRPSESPARGSRDFRLSAEPPGKSRDPTCSHPDDQNALTMLVIPC